MRYYFTIFSILVLPLSAAPLSGIKTVGPTAANYPSLTAAIADIQAQKLSGPLVLELQSGYLSNVESFPLVFTNLSTSATNTLTLRPRSGASNLRIASANTTAATVDLNGAQFVTIDGRPGGTGTVKQLTIANTSTSGRAMRFINESSGNTLRYLTFQGVNTSSSSGTVVFSTTTGANGNDNNTIDTCDIGGGVSTPTNCIYSAGSATTTAQNNSGNTISNCNVFDFFAASSVDVAGVRLDGGNDSWTLTGNSFYQTAVRALSAGTIRPIYINGGPGGQFSVTDNFIGGSAPNAGGSPWTTTGGSGSNPFEGIRINIAADLTGSVRGNTIRNVVWTTTGTGGDMIPWVGIYLSIGSFENSAVMGNMIGSGTGTGSIFVTTSTVQGTTYGIRVTSNGSGTLSDNIIGSITTNASMIGIGISAHTMTLTNNIVGSTTTANSLSAGTASVPAGVTGIQSSGEFSTNIGNMVANLNNNYTGPSSVGLTRGIVTSTFGDAMVVGNTVRNLSTASQSMDSAERASVVGISASVSWRSPTISRNVVHSLSNTTSSAAVEVTGIYSSGGNNSGMLLIAGNLVHSLAIASTNTSSRLYGMYLGFGTFTAQNNMVRVGLAADGTSTAGASEVVGIYDGGSTVGRNFYHNSVYVGGTQTSGASKTYAFRSSGTTNTRDFRNNIFANARSNSGATSKHYAVQYNGALANPAGLVANHNLLFANGSGGVLGIYDNMDRSTLAAWQAATGQDASSAVADPGFVNPTGTSATVDLHLQPSNPAEGGGVAIAAVSDDFDGQTRSSLSPTDIGADASNFTSSTGDIYAPSIRFPLLSNGTTANRVLTSWASIADNSGMISGALSAPRIYYKKSTDADTFNTTNSGWKYVTATDAGNGRYSFTIDYSLLNDGSVSLGDSIEYFIVAQDAANNLGSSPTTASAGANPLVANISGKPSSGVNSYSIVAPFSSTVTVGPGGTYSSLTYEDGLFAALNSGILDGSLTVNITGDSYENGSTVLNAISANHFPSPPVTIRPNSATMRTISNYGSGIKLSGTQGLHIDGSFGGSGQYLTFRNPSTNGSTLSFVNDASNNTVRNCIIEGAQYNSNPDAGGVVFFGKGVTTGNDNNTVAGNQIRSLSNGAEVSSDLVFSAGTSDDLANSNNIISNNEMINFNYTGVNLYSGSASWTITGNSIYQTAMRTNALYGIRISGLGTNEISGNTIRDLKSSSWTNGISVFNQRGDTTVSGNRVWNIGNTSGSTASAYGISLYSGEGQNLTVVNNMIALSSSGTTGQNLYGISDNGQTGSTTSVANNTVILSGSGGAGKDTWAFSYGGSSTATVKNNLLLNLRTGGGNHFAANYSTASAGSLTMDNNVYAGTGLSNATNFFDASNANSPTGTPISYAQWKVNVSSDIHSSTGNPGGNYTSAMFVDAANGDLHLIPGGNPLVNNAASPVAGVTTDFDGDARSLTAPEIGADELPTAFSQWAQINGISGNPQALGANGLANLLNFAFGINPTVPSRSELSYSGNVIIPGGINTQVVGGASTVRYMRHANFLSMGLNYKAQFSMDLLTWETDNTTPTVLAMDGVNEVVGLGYPVLSGGEQGRFFRVVVSLD